MEHDELMERLARFGVLRRSYGDAARHLVPLLAPSALVLVPLSLLATLVLVIAVNDGLIVVNGEPELTDVPAGASWVWAAAVPVVWLVLAVLVFPAIVTVAAGRLLGRRVPPVAALRAAARRAPALLALALLALAWLAAVVAVAFWVLLVLGQGWMWIIGTVLLLAALPALLAVPGVVLERRSAPAAVVRAYRLSARWLHVTAFTLLIGTVALPLAAAWALDRGVDGLSGPALTIVSGTAGVALSLLVTPFQAMVVTRQFLYHVARFPDAGALGDIVERLPAGPSGPARPVPVLASLLLPGLAFGAIVLVNPLGLPEIAETYAQQTLARDPAYFDEGSARLSPGELRAVFAGPGEGVTVLTDSGFDSASQLLTCSDVRCTRLSNRWGGRNEQMREAIHPPSASTRLPDGRLLVVRWERTEDRWRARLLTCDGRGCLDAPGGTYVTQVRDLHPRPNLALAARPGGGVVLVQAAEVPAGDFEPSVAETFSLIVCDDVACSRPRTKPVARVNSRAFVRAPHSLAVAMGPGGRAVAARLDSLTGALHVISCADPACERVRVRRPVAPIWEDLREAGPTAEVNRRFDESGDYGHLAGVSLAVRADGRPLIAYRSAVGGAVHLLDCRTPDCAAGDSLMLAPSGVEHAAPALVLDRSGRALVAYQDLEGRRIMLATCSGLDCAVVPVRNMRHGPGPALAMTLDGAGRPYIVWTDVGYADAEVVITVPLNLPWPHQTRSPRAVR
ncbi:hypothetical protein AB0C27_34585 [Nonomuraea sp. NPDC048882]|uniref:hypothetical protein n=1 Tax=Nonomuraea sp. NPDC048882 TaxID=3154347 RepID=UPI0033D8DA2E